MADKDVLSPIEHLFDKIKMPSFPETITFGLAKNTIDFFKEAIKPNSEKDKPVILNMQNLLLMADIAIKSMPLITAGIVLNHSGVFPAYIAYDATKGLIYGAKGGGYKASRDTPSSQLEVWKTAISKSKGKDNSREEEIDAAISKVVKKRNQKQKQLFLKYHKGKER